MNVKRTIAVLLMVAVLLAIMPAAAFAASKTQVYRVNTKTDPLMVHSQPNDQKSTRVGRLPRNAAVIVLKKSGSWWQIKSSRRLIGWVFAKYLAPGAYARVTTKTDPLVIRKSASSKSTKLGSAPKGSTVTVKYVSGNWANITYQSTTGWSSRTYLTWIAG